MNHTHEFRVRKILKTGSGIDTLNPESAEVAFFVFTVAIGIGKTFFPGVFGDGPDVLAATIVTAGEFQNFFTTSARGYVVY